MKKWIVKTLTLCLSLGLTAGVAFAQADKTMTGKLVKGTQVLGAKVFNQNAEHLGEIKDILFDENEGGVAYGVLSIGGWLGIGNDLTVVPWKFIKQSKGDSPGFVVDLDKAKLKDAPHFADNSWPDMNDQWNMTAATYYGVDSAMLKGKKLVRASEAIGSKLWNQKAEEIGDIEDLLMHPNSGKVAYGVLSVGQWMNMGDKLVTVPWSLIRQSKGASPGYVLNVDKSKLKPEYFFDSNQWPDYNDPAWNTRTYSYYGVSPYWYHPFVY